MSGNFSTVLQDDFLDAARQRSDPPADAALSALIQRIGKEAARELFDTLIRQIELSMDTLPPEIVDFVNQHRQLPDWADEEKIRAGQDLFVDHGPKFLLFLYYKSLPILYSCAHGAKVLIHTGRLTQKDALRIFSRRIAETGQFLINVMEGGSFDAKGLAIDTTLKIRLIHAAIRQFIPEEHWNAATWGQPINQEDMAITLMTFSVALTDALSTVGIEEPPERQEAFLHCWNIIGHLLGLEADFLPPDISSARQLLNTIQERQAAASPEGQQLTQALISFAEQVLPSERFKSAPRILIPFFIGEEQADLLGVNQNVGCLMRLLPAALKSLFKLGEKLEDQSLPIHILFDKISVELVEKMVGYFNAEKRQHFRVPEGW